MNSLDSAESFLDLVFEKLPVGAVIINQNKQIKKTNPKLIRMLGMTGEKDLVGKSCARLLCPDGKKGCPAMDRTVILESSETTLLHASGKSIPVKRKITRAEIDGETFIIEFYEDLSRFNRIQEAYKQSKQRLLTFLESCIDPVLIHDLDGQAVYANPAFESVFGWSRKDLQTANGFIPDGADGKTVIPDTLASPVFNIQSIRVSKTGQHIPVRMNAAPLNDDHGGPGGNVVFLQPIDYSGPGLGGAADETAAGRPDDSIPAIEFDLRTVMDDIRDQFSVSAVQQGIDFDMTIHQFVPSLLRGDPWRLRQVLHHLLSSVFAAAGKGGVTVTAVPENEGLQTVAIRFEVGGTGTPDAAADLKIVKPVIEGLKGRMGTETTEGQGIVYKFTLPFEKQTVREEPPIFKLRSLSGIHILAVSDDLEMTRSLQTVCTAWECRFDDASDEKEAMEKMEIFLEDNTPFDLIIIDLQMGRSDPEQLAREIKENPELSDTPIIMLSGNGKRGDAQRLKSIGVAGYLPRTAAPEQLHDCAATVLAAAFPSDRDFVTRHSLKEDRKRHIRILLAEDNTVNQKLVMNILKKSGYTATAVKYGQSALEEFETGRYDIIYMDIQTPLVDGYNTIKAIREAETGDPLAPIPIIAMTAGTVDDMQEKNREYGITDYIHKPVMPMILLDSVAKWTWQREKTENTD